MDLMVHATQPLNNYQPPEAIFLDCVFVVFIHPSTKNTRHTLNLHVHVHALTGSKVRTRMAGNHKRIVWVYINLKG